MDWLKTLHVACVVLSVGGYFARGVLRRRDSPWLQARFVRIAPHVVDTLLLVSGVALAVRLQQYPFVHGWLTAKVLALLAYIVLGAVGLKYGKSAAQGCADCGAEGCKTRRVRTVAWVAALLTFGYIVAVALTRQVLPFLASD